RAGTRRVQNLRVAALLELFERFAAHRGVDVQVRDADHRAQLFQHEEADAVMDHLLPRTAPNHVALVLAQLRGGEYGLGIGQERRAVGRYDQLVQKLVDAVGFDAALERERIRP